MATKSIQILDETLPDGAWKDSFDKLLDPRPVLRELNVLKKEVRVSFNINSSVENSQHQNSASFGREGNLIKTQPAVNCYIQKPFQCSLSPIGGIKSKLLKTKKSNPMDKNKVKRLQKFSATPIKPGRVEVMEFDEKSTTNSSNSSNSIIRRPAPCKPNHVPIKKPYKPGPKCARKSQNGRLPKVVMHKPTIEIVSGNSISLGASNIEDKCDRENSIQSKRRCTESAYQPSSFMRGISPVAASTPIQKNAAKSKEVQHTKPRSVHVPALSVFDKASYNELNNQTGLKSPFEFAPNKRVQTLKNQELPVAVEKTRSPFPVMDSVNMPRIHFIGEVADQLAADSALSIELPATPGFGNTSVRLISRNFNLDLEEIAASTPKAVKSKINRKTVPSASVGSVHLTDEQKINAIEVLAKSKATEDCALVVNPIGSLDLHETNQQDCICVHNEISKRNNLSCAVQPNVNPIDEGSPTTDNQIGINVSNPNHGSTYNESSIARKRQNRGKKLYLDTSARVRAYENPNKINLNESKRRSDGSGDNSDVAHNTRKSTTSATTCNESSVIRKRQNRGKKIYLDTSARVRAYENPNKINLNESKRRSDGSGDNSDVAHNTRKSTTSATTCNESSVTRKRQNRGKKIYPDISARAHRVVKRQRAYESPKKDNLNESKRRSDGSGYNFDIADNSSTSKTLTPTKKRVRVLRPRKEVAPSNKQNAAKRTTHNKTVAGRSESPRRTVKFDDQSLEHTLKAKQTVQNQEVVSVTLKDTTTNMNNTSVVGQIIMAGGKWRKTLSEWRRRTFIELRRTLVDTANSLFSRQPSKSMGERKSYHIKRTHKAQPPEDARRCVFERCDQTSPLLFDELYTADNLSECRKLGEGAFGEVFMYTDVTSKEKTVMKVIPIEGDMLVNEEQQKTFTEILSEILITQELSKLRNKDLHTNVTSTFVNAKKVKCVKGKYPAILLKNWGDFCKDKGTDNDDPSLFKEEQLYIVLELEFGGKDMEQFEFTSAEQAYSALQQVVYGLAVAEKELSFEHRDLHWGNLLLEHTKKKFIEFTLDGKTIKLRSKGVKVTIIDYTLSRVTYKDVIYYNDLSMEEDLFCATGDHQYDIYRLSRQKLNNIWTKFCPKTNVFWVHYLVDKMLNNCAYKKSRAKTHMEFMKKLQTLKDTVLGANNSAEVIPLFGEIS